MDDMKILWLVFWLLFSAGVALIAMGRGRQPLIWFLVAFVLSPVIALLIMILVPSRDPSITTLRSATASELLARLEEKFNDGVLTAREIKDLRALARRDPPQPGSRPTPVAIVPLQSAADFTRPCPSCGQLVHPKATTCMHCWAKITPALA